MAEDGTQKERPDRAGPDSDPGDDEEDDGEGDGAGSLETSGWLEKRAKVRWTVRQKNFIKGSGGIGLTSGIIQSRHYLFPHLAAFPALLAVNSSSSFHPSLYRQEN